MTEITAGATRLEQFGVGVLRWRWPIIALTILFVVFMAAGGQNLKISNDSRIFFSEDNPQLIAFEALEATYTEANTVLIAVAPKEESGATSIFTADALGAIAELTERGWLLPYSTRVDSLTNFSHTWADGDELIVEDLVPETGEFSAQDLARVEDIAMSEIQLVNRLVAADGGTTAVLVNFVLPDESAEAVTEISDEVKVIVAEARLAHPELNYYVTGSVITSRAFGDATMDDLATLGPIIIGVILVVMAVLLRSITGTIATLLVVLFAAITAMGFAGWSGMILSSGNVGAPTIIMTVAIAHSVHVISTIMLGMRGGLAKREAILESLRVNFHPVFLTTITTAIGFLSMNFSDAPPFHNLGNLVALGVVSAFVFALTFVPALVYILPLRVRPRREGQSVFFDGFGAFVVRRRTPLLWGMAAIIIGLAAGIPQVELNDNWTKYFDERYEFRRDTDYIINNLTGVEAFEFSLPAGSEGAINDPEYIARVDQFAEWYRSQPKIIHVSAFPDIMKRLNKNMHGDDPAYYRIPEEHDLAAQYLLLYELSLPFGRDLNDQIDVGKSATRMTVVGRDMSAQEQRASADAANQWLKDNMPAEMATEATGLTMMFAYISKRNIEGMLKGTVIAMAIISLILIIALKSIPIGLLSLMPNFVPAAMSFGLWGYMIGNVGVAASVVTAVTFGIVVDDTIHFLSKYLRARRERKLDPQQAVRFAFSSVGHALWTTTAVLAAGFIVLSTSGFEVNWSLGLLTAMTIVIALAADFFFLPPLLMKLDRSKS
ncbi:MAG: MMPL family transporter [Rhodospirillaceae bacterium]|nr:MMPL family transporter [Rhodospirillaceae bacterium]MBT7291921.1 MMPL family transporter [Rhodospirillaceae bacterium]